MDKAPDAFRTISEVADDLDVPQHVLRFWETRFAQIKPMKRGGGRCYYRPNDVDLLKGIRQLLYGEGFTIKGVQRILRENGVGHVAGIGRGEIEVTAQPTEEAKAPTGPGPAARPVPSKPAPGPAAGAPALTAAQKDELRNALADLASARRTLAGVLG